MATRLRILFVLCVAVVVSACMPPVNVNIKVNSGVAAGKEEDEKEEELVPYEPEWQRRIANHEGGHAIAVAYLFGPGAVKHIRLRTVSGKKGINYAGLVTPATGLTYETKDDILRDITMRLASRAAEIAVDGSARTSVASDLQAATERAWSICVTYGFCDTLLVTDKANAPPAMRDVVRRFVDVDADSCAVAIVAANVETIKVVATALIIKGEKEYERRIDNAEFAEILRVHPLQPAVDPATGPLPAFCKMHP